MVGTRQRPAFSQLFLDFTKETGIDVEMTPYRDAAYKQALPKLMADPIPPDVVYWQASMRLFEYAQKKALRPLTTLWENENYDAAFPHLKSMLTYNSEVYAIPFTYYGWGLYYNAAIVDKYGGPPETWEQFLTLCRKIKKAGIDPIAVGTKDHWPAAIWFDIFNLRINGIAFHMALLSGRIPFTDQRVQKVFLEWKKLVDNNYYNKESRTKYWDQKFPNLFWGEAAFCLIGNFTQTRFGKEVLVSKNIKMIPFPKINDIPRYEEAPTDVFMIPEKCRNVKEAEIFLKYIARPDVQVKLNKALGCLPPHQAAAATGTEFQTTKINLLKNAKAISQYFDRDTVPAFEKKAVPLLAEFIETGDIEKITEKLEIFRKDTFDPDNRQKPWRN